MAAINKAVRNWIKLRPTQTATTYSILDDMGYWLRQVC